MPIERNCERTVQSPALITIYSKEGLEELISYSDAKEFLIGRQDLQNCHGKGNTLLL